MIGIPPIPISKKLLVAPGIARIKKLLGPTRGLFVSSQRPSAMCCVFPPHARLWLPWTGFLRMFPGEGGKERHTAFDANSFDEQRCRGTWNSEHGGSKNRGSLRLACALPFDLNLCKGKFGAESCDPKALGRGPDSVSDFDEVYENFLQEWTRADVNKDGVVSEEEFTMELKDRSTEANRMQDPSPVATIVSHLKASKEERRD